MSDSTGDRAYARDVRRQPVIVWFALLAFFAGLAVVTVAVVLLPEDESTSIVLGVAGGVLAALGLGVTLARGDLTGLE